MHITLAELEKQATLLVPGERARLVEILLESLHNNSLSDLETAWQREIEKRIELYERGETELFQSEQVFAEARRMSR